MNIPEKPTKAVVSVVEMASMCLLSRSRFYSLIHASIFPEPIRNESCKRPVYDLEMQQKCLDIRRSGIGANGQPVLFNRRAKSSGNKKRPKLTNNHTDLIETLKSLGLQVSDEAVESALNNLFPSGWADVDEGQRVRQVFLYLQNKK